MALLAPLYVIYMYIVEYKTLKTLDSLKMQFRLVQAVILDISVFPLQVDHCITLVPLLVGHSQQRPPSLMWPQLFGATTMNAFTSPSRQRPPL